jgi:hypothetical protein
MADHFEENIRQQASLPRRGASPGKRGPGAPPGNMNALKHGRTSRQFAELGALIASDPVTRAALLNFRRRLGLKEQRAQEVAALLLTGIMEKARASGGQLNIALPADDVKSIVEGAARAKARGYAAPLKTRTSRKNNSRPGTGDANQ